MFWPGIRRLALWAPERRIMIRGRTHTLSLNLICTIHVLDKCESIQWTQDECTTQVLSPMGPTSMFIPVKKLGHLWEFIMNMLASYCIVGMRQCGFMNQDVNRSSLLYPMSSASQPGYFCRVWVRQCPSTASWMVESWSPTSAWCDARYELFSQIQWLGEQTRQLWADPVDLSSKFHHLVILSLE